MKNNWKYLDKFDGNLIFSYIKSLTTKKSSRFINPYSVNETGDEERDEFNKAELRRKTAFYLYWYVFRYVLGCETVEDAIPYANEETLKKYKIHNFMKDTNKLKSGWFYIGIHNEEISLYKPEDIKTILEILYNRYDFFEQLECFLRNSSVNRGVSRNRCKKTLEKSKEFLEKRGSVVS